jgi:hypothetical protein
MLIFAMSNKKDMRKSNTTVYKNGAIVRLRNRRIVIQEDNDKGEVLLVFSNVDDKPEIPSVYHRVIRGKIRESGLKISIEAMESMIEAYINYRRDRGVGELNDKIEDK